MQSLIRNLQYIDRRWIYLALVSVLLISLMLGKPIDPIVLPYVEQLYTEVEKAPAAPENGKLVLLGLTFSGSTLPESGNQARALMRHLMLRGKRFAIIAIADPQGATLGRQMAEDLSKLYGYEYGKDWISFGYKPGTLAFFTAFPRDVQGTIGNDGVQNKPLSTFPVMRTVKTIKDIPLVIEVTSTASAMSWIGYVQGKYKVKLGYGATGVMAAEAYPFLDSGQVVGLLPGMKGAADYEKLVDTLEAQEIAAGRDIEPFDNTKMATGVNFSTARKLMFTQSAAHIVIILFILLGNVGLLLSRRSAKQSTEEGA